MDEEEIRKNKDPKRDKTFVLNLGFLERFRQLISDLSIDVQKNFDYKKNDFLVRPRAPGVYPAILVLHDWWGLDDFVRSICLKLAKKGFVAFAPSLYEGEVTNREAIARVLMKNADPSQVVPVIESYFEKLMTYPFVNPRNIGAFGFLMGGYYSLLAASRIPELAAAAVVYGRFPGDILDNLSDIHCPVFMASGSLDDWLEREEFNLIGEMLTSGEVKVTKRNYDNVGQAFMDDLHSESFDYVSAEEAWKNIIDFFAANLKRGDLRQDRLAKRRFGQWGGLIDWLEKSFLGEQLLRLIEAAIGEEVKKVKS